MGWLVTKNEKAFTLIEVLVSLALLGIIAIALCTGLIMANKAVIVSDERATAESLARSQMESVKNQGYITAMDYSAEVPGSGEVIYAKIDEIPEGYTIRSINRQDVPVEDIIGVPWNLDPEMGQGGPLEKDYGLQLIRLVIKHGDKEVMTLEGAKVNR